MNSSRNGAEMSGSGSERMTSQNTANFKTASTRLRHWIKLKYKYEMINQIKGGIYHKIQIDLTYNSNHIEGYTLTHEQTR